MIDCRKSSILCPSSLSSFIWFFFQNPPQKAMPINFHPHPKKKRPFFGQLINNWLTKIKLVEKNWAGLEKIKLEVKIELQHLQAVIPNKLAFTSFHCSISKYTLKGRNNSYASETSFQLRSDKPSHKHGLNKYQSKTFLICDQRFLLCSLHPFIPLFRSPPNFLDELTWKRLLPMLP